MKAESKNVYELFVDAILEMKKSPDTGLPKFVITDFRLLDTVMKYYEWYNISDKVNELKTILNIRIPKYNKENYKSKGDFGETIEFLYHFEVVYSFYKTIYIFFRELQDFYKNYYKSKPGKETYDILEGTFADNDTNIYKFIENYHKDTNWNKNLKKSIEDLKNRRTQKRRFNKTDLYSTPYFVLKVNYMLTNAKTFKDDYFSTLINNLIFYEEEFNKSINWISDNCFIDKNNSSKELKDYINKYNYLIKKELILVNENDDTNKAKDDSNFDEITQELSIIKFEKTKNLFEYIQKKYKYLQHHNQLFNSLYEGKRGIYKSRDFAKALEAFIKEDFFYYVFNNVDEEIGKIRYLFFSSWLCKQLNPDNPIASKKPLKGKDGFAKEFINDVICLKEKPIINMDLKKQKGLVKAEYIIPQFELEEKVNEFLKYNKKTLEKFVRQYKKFTDIQSEVIKYSEYSFRKLHTDKQKSGH